MSEAPTTFKYFITIARRGGLTDEMICKITKYLEARFTQVVMNVEPHKTGLLHLHAFAHSPVKTSSAIRNHFKRFLEGINLEIGKNTLNVKVADDNVINYVVKEVTEKSPVTLCKGWSIADLLEKRQIALKKLSIKSAKGTDKVLSQDEVVPMIIRFAKNDGTSLDSKESFKSIVKKMVRLGFSFSRCKMASTYAEVMCRCGDDRALDDLLDMQLIGLSG